MSLFATAFNLHGFVKGIELLKSGISGAISDAAPIFAYIVPTVWKVFYQKGVRNYGGLFGVVLIANPISNELTSFAIENVLFMIMASLCLGALFVYSNRFISPLKRYASALTTYQLGIACIIYYFIIDQLGAFLLSDQWKGKAANLRDVTSS